MQSTEVISHSVHRAIVLVGYGTGAVPGTNGLRYEYDTFRTSVQEYAQFSIENVLLSVVLRTCTPHHAVRMKVRGTMRDECGMCGEHSGNALTTTSRVARHGFCTR